MKNNILSSVSGRRSLVIWAVFCSIAAFTFLSYVLTSLANGNGTLLMPLDDVYIHFQYARQLAAGQPYVYNPGLVPTSGATSFLYPYILAIGYLIGFQGLQFGLWAMAAGALAMVGAMRVVYKLVAALGTGDTLAVLVAVAFGTNGAVAWHFMSGMETGLVMLLTLGTLYAVIRFDGSRIRTVVVWAGMLALMRPEGGLLAVVAMGAVLWRWWGNRETASNNRLRSCLWLLLPVLAVGVQPLVNLVMTGSAVASGNSAKSVLGAVPFEPDDVIRRVVENFVRMWVEFSTGISPREGLYILPLLLILAVVGIGLLLLLRELRPVGVMLALWLLGGTLMLATLDTAFWHFKRYQMPFMALLFPLAGWGVGVVSSFKLQVKSRREIHLTTEAQTTQRNTAREEYGEPPSRQERQDVSSQRISVAAVVMSVAVSGMLVVSVITSIQFLRYYGLNVSYVYQQPYQMAQWLEANTPSDAVVAVHDVGMMRYMGGRTTLDIVGLTTKGAADYWRNGPGAVAEFLMQEQPDYIASYGEGHGYGLGMIADTAIYGEPLASFPVELDDTANVALAANFQGIYKPDWNAVLQGKDTPIQASTLNYLARLGNDSAVEMIDVANLQSETASHYVWKATERFVGFPTEVHAFGYPACSGADCQVIDGVRRIDGEESFEVMPPIMGDAILVTRVHSAEMLTYDVYVTSNGSEHLVGTRFVPAMPGQWLEIPMLISKDYVVADVPLKVRIVVHGSGAYYTPAFHWLYFGSYAVESVPINPVATFQDGAMQLSAATLDYRADSAQLDVNLDWYTDGSVTGDYKVFVHLYKDVNSPPVAQMDTRPGNGTLPPQNWLAGVLHDTITVDLKDVPAGTYQVAIGLYDPVTFERLQPTGGDEQGRLFIGEVEVKG